MGAPYQRIHVVVNPASGKNEPILNTLNDVFHKHEIDWDVSVTKKYGDATTQALDAISRGVDLVTGYGGDGTQHEIANAVLKSGTTTTTMGILPGGTGNGFAREMGIPKTLAEAAEVLATSTNTRAIDVGRANDEFFIQRLYVGVEPEEQTSRELKDKYGVMAYAVGIGKRTKGTNVRYRATVDGDQVEFDAAKVYVINSGMMGTGLAITDYAIDDGLFDAFGLDTSNLDTFYSAADRFLHLNTAQASKYHRQCRDITIETEPDQPVWNDGEYLGRTPIRVMIVPGALRIAVP